MNDRNRCRRTATRWGAGALALMVLGFAVASGAARAAEEHPRVRLTTSLGDIDVELFEQKAPETVKNFLRLVDKGFYDGLIFHRVIPGFMIQAGGYDQHMNFKEPPNSVDNESSNGLENRTGTLAMARLSDPDSADSQFFINVADNEHLNGRPGQPGYTVFGQVIAGMDVVNAIAKTDTTSRGGMADIPVTPIVIEHAKRL